MSKRPNIILLLNDHQTYYAHGEMSGGPKILCPNFEKLASQGINFTRAYTGNRYKYVYNHRDIDELYDLKEDPYELNNLISTKNFGPILDDLRTWLTY